MNLASDKNRYIQENGALKMKEGVEMVERFRAFVRQAGWLSRDERVLLAVSGGVDSVVLADLFREAGFPFAIAHCNFQLRGEASDADARFVGRFAASLGVPFFETVFRTEELALERGWSIQVAARNLRYEWLEEIRSRHGYDWIATAHHLNDSIETALYNWTKGTGLRGLLGIPPQQGKIIRPLSFATRREVEAYLEKRGLDYRTDASNLEDKYSRNKIRRHIWPVLEKINPGLENTFRENLERLREINLIYEWGLDKLRAEWTVQDGDAFRIAIAPLRTFPAAKTLLFEWLRDYGFSNRQTEQIHVSLDHDPGAMFYSNTHRVLLDREWLIVTPLPAEDARAEYPVFRGDQTIRLPEGHLEICLLSGRPAAFSADESEAFLDADQLTFPLSLRRWQAGDRFAPLGMGGRQQKLQDFFSDRKLSRFEKEAIWLLVDGEGEIAWVVGLRLAEPFRITPATKTYLQLRFQKL